MMVIVMLLFWVNPAASIECGVASTQFNQNPPVVASAVQSGKLSFWWNWDTSTKVDTGGMTPATIDAMNKVFVPMLWGQAPPGDYNFLTSTEGSVMGYNEPDLYGPSCCNCDGKQSYYPATSSGWLPLFNPVSAASYWKDTVNNMTSAQHVGTTLKRIISPSMANGAKPQAGIDCTLDPAAPGNPKRCEGWLSLFKEAALKLDCARFDGTRTNCWDVIDAIQIHSYAKTAAEVLAKINGYQSQFQDDFSGSSGRSKKTLWLTEVAAGSHDGAEVVQFVKDLMATSGGLPDRSQFPEVERVSWFSEWFFPAFNVSGVPARPNENWVSSLFNPYGGLSDVGTAFFANCATSGV
jgi:hypothetical protein